MDAARLRAVSNGAAWGDDAQEQCVRLRAVEEAAIRSRRCVIALLPPCRQRKNSSHTLIRLLSIASVPAAPSNEPKSGLVFAARLRVVCPPCAVPRRLLLRMFPRAFKNEPLPCARMYAALSRHTSIAGRNLCVPRVQRCPPSPGSERSGMMRTSTDSFRGQGELEVKPDDLTGNRSRSIGSKEPLFRARSLSWREDRRQGEPPFSRQYVNTGKYPSLSASPQVLRERIST